MDIKLSDHFTYRRLIRFVLPSIFMMIFTSIYGVVSAVLSFLRTLLFQVAAVMILPMFFGLNGIWASIVAAEVVALFVSVVCLKKFRKRYGY